MGLNETPSSERIHIGIFGKRNAGKSSVINAITNQNLAIVSEQKGTTTDPVYKAMELLPLGPVMLIDTPGLDDLGKLGQLRVEKAYQVLNKTDIALVIIDATSGITQEDTELIEQIKKKNLNYLLVFNKADEAPAFIIPAEYAQDSILVSAVTKLHIQELKEKLAHLVPNKDMTLKLIGDLLQPLDLVVLVVPIDSAAPKGRLILPQQQTIRDILEARALSLVVQTSELEDTLKRFGSQVKMVVTDSQAFAQVSKITPPHILLTSFSILFARYKGDLVTSIKGAQALDKIKDGDKILIAEGCTHHRQCNDIGTVKLPGWIKKYTGKEPVFEFSSGIEFPRDLSPYKLIVHCGACMLNEKEVKYRIATAVAQNIPITNYGITIAYLHGILKRTVEPFPAIHALLEK